MPAMKKSILLYAANRIKFDGRITTLPLKEELIIRKSIEFFNDASPCFIHRSAVMKRVFCELEDFLENGLINGKNEWVWAEIPDSLKDILIISAPIEKIVYR